MIQTICSIFCIFFCIPAFFCSAMAKEQGFEGTVVKHMDAPGYTYLLIQIDSQKQQWAAIPITPIQTGDHVALAPGLTMKEFHSQTFNKTFASIFFSEGLLRTAPTGSAQAAPPQQGDKDFAAAVSKEQQEEHQDFPAPMKIQEATRMSSPGSQGAIVPFVDIAVSKAKDANAVTVAELFQTAQELQGTRVRIHGLVVKFNAQIMGKNWIHLQDGTGDPMHNTHDLVLTTGEDVQRGETILVEGTVAVNKDFGYGYSYPVLLEDTTIITRH